MTITALVVLYLNERDVQFGIPANAGFFIIWRAYFMTSENTHQAPQPIKKRIPPKAGQGRVKGVPNKMTRILKEAVVKAAENAGNKIGKDGLISYLERYYHKKHNKVNMLFEIILYESTQESILLCMFKLTIFYIRLACMNRP